MLGQTARWHTPKDETLQRRRGLNSHRLPFIFRTKGGGLLEQSINGHPFCWRDGPRVLWVVQVDVVRRFIRRRVLLFRDVYKEGVNVLDHVVVVLETCDVGGGGESTVQCPQPLSATHVHDGGEGQALGQSSASGRF